MATLANGLAKALGENGHAESNDDLHSYELQLEVPKNRQISTGNVGWLGSLGGWVMDSFLDS